MAIKSALHREEIIKK